MARMLVIVLPYNPLLLAWFTRFMYSTLYTAIEFLASWNLLERET